MNILKEWKLLTKEYNSCSTEQEFYSFLLENHDKIIKLYEFTNNAKYPALLNKNATIRGRGGDAPRAVTVGYGQSIENPDRPGDIQAVFGFGEGEQKTRRIVFKVPGDDWPHSKDIYTVVIQFSKVGPTSGQLRNLKAIDRLKQLDVMVKCDCPFFIWNGPEWNAAKHNYLYPASHGGAIGYNTNKAKWDAANRGWNGDYANTGRDQGKRDPGREYWICKHVAAVFQILSKQANLPISYFQSSEQAADVADPGYPGTGQQPTQQMGFVFPSLQEGPPEEEPT
jgi:hypothetical protein